MIFIKDIIEKLDNVEEILNEIKVNNKSLKQAEDDKIQEDFDVKIEEYFEDKKCATVIGKFSDYAATADERFINFAAFLDECVARTKSGDFVDGDKLYMTPRHAKNLKDEAIKMFRYAEDKLLKSPTDACNSKDMQGYIIERSFRSKENKETTMQGIKNKIQKINLLENLATGNKNNYSSNVRTPEELQEFNNLKKPKIEEDNRSKAMSNADYQKVFDSLYDKLKRDPTSLNETEAAFLIMGEFGLRPSTVTKIKIDQVDIKNCGLEVEVKQNKSKQMFVAKTSAVEPVTQVTQEILSGLYKRAMLKYRPDKDGNILLVNCCYQNLDQGFSKLMSEHGINMDKYNGQYKLLRHRFAQNAYTEYRQAFIDSDGTEVSKKARAIKEINYLLGHESKKIKTTMGYIKNIW